MNNKEQNELTFGVHRRSILFFFLLMSFHLFSCDDQEHKQSQPKVFFDLRGFLEGQIVKLNQEKPLVSKKVGIGQEQNLVSSRDIDWKKELELFLQADINKPAYRQSYSTIRPDSLTYQYFIKQGQTLPVRYLKIKLNRSGGLPIHIEGLLKSENKLYESEKKLDLDCIISNNTSRISNYRIVGFQKLITMEKKPFNVDAKIGH